ncbi:MAG: MBL fold metallo-hydrolase [Cyclobacteriaceae bacterium]|nr:MBL fold metallo-hydrolase [Cyclobacteriaceae bacterium]UYN85379.1 MAG: MBL fold metallo-hydrolase [Cyclobacteriaceae bacterium]
MKKIIALYFLIFSFSLIQAQRPKPDAIETAKGSLTIQPILHATLVLTWNGITIYVDPYGGAKAFEGLAAPNLILITDIHGDHLNMETLKTIETARAIIIAPHAVREQLPENLANQTIPLANGSSIKQFDITITAIPMYNLPETDDSRHPRGRGNGYVLSLGEKQIYISGDTEDIAEMRALKNIDLAFVCMNQPFTMTIEQAASAVLEFKPKIVYPFHYRGQGGLSDVEAFKKLIQKGNLAIDVRLRNWYPAY